MVKSGSWEGFERDSKVASKLETVSLGYRYDLIDPDSPNDLKVFLLALEENSEVLALPTDLVEGVITISRRLYLL